MKRGSKFVVNGAVTTKPLVYVSGPHRWRRRPFVLVNGKVVNVKRFGPERLVIEKVDVAKRLNAEPTSEEPTSGSKHPAGSNPADDPKLAAERPRTDTPRRVRFPAPLRAASRASPR